MSDGHVTGTKIGCQGMEWGEGGGGVGGDVLEGGKAEEELVEGRKVGEERKEVGGDRGGRENRRGTGRREG